MIMLTIVAIRTLHTIYRNKQNITFLYIERKYSLDENATTI